MTIVTYVNNGLPVRASGDIRDAEPLVGLMSQFVENMDVTFPNGYPLPFELSDKDDQRIVNELINAHNEPPWDV